MFTAKLTADGRVVFKGINLFFAKIKSFWKMI